MAVDKETKAEAVSAARRGISHAQIAKVAGVQPRTIGRWLKEADAAPTPKVETPALDSDPEPAPELTGDTLDQTRQMLARSLAQSKAAEKDGNHTAAQRYMAIATGLTNTIARLEKNQADNADELRISRVEIDDAREMVRTRLMALAERPMLCAGCGKKLSISYGDPPEGKGT